MDPNLTNPVSTGTQPNNPIPTSTPPPQNNIPSSNINPALTQDTSLPWTQNTLNPEVVPKTVPLGSPQVPAPSALYTQIPTPQPPPQPEHTYPTIAVAPDHVEPPPPPAQNEEQFSNRVIPPRGKKFPVLIATVLVILTVTGFSSSYLYFRAMGKTPQNQIKAPLITPPVTQSSENTDLNSINTSTNSASYKNPFDPATAGQNPFSNESEFQNPFGEDASDSAGQPYQNPFDPPAGGLTPTP